MKTFYLLICTLLVVSTSYAQPCQDSWVYVSKDVAEAGHEEGQDDTGDVVDVAKYEDKPMNDNMKVHFIRYRACLTPQEIAELMERETVDVSITEFDKVKISDYQTWLADPDDPRIIKKITQAGDYYLVEWAIISKQPVRFRKRKLDIDKLKTKEEKDVTAKELKDNTILKPDLGVPVTP